MKLNVDIRQDENFINKVKELILQQINSIIKTKKDLQKYVEQLIDKYIQRNVIEKYISDELKKIINYTEIRTSTRYGAKRFNLSEYMKHQIDTLIKDKIQDLLMEYSIDIKKVKP